MAKTKQLLCISCLSTRVGGDGNCLFNAVSILLIGDVTLAYTLRVLTAAELYTQAEWYASHSHFDNVSKALINSSSNNLFVEAMTDAGCHTFSETKNRIMALKEEANHVVQNFWVTVVD